MKKMAFVLGVLLLSGLAMGQALPVRTGKTAAAGKAAVSAPYVCGFDKEEEVQQWLVTDLDKDGESWQQVRLADWPSLEGDASNAVVAAPTISKEGEYSNDWLLMRNPIALKAGKAYVAFLYASGHRSEEFPETLAVYVGKTNSAADLQANGTKLEEWTFHGRAWKFKHLIVDIEEDGEYYFAFRHLSQNKGKESSYSIIDAVEIGEGAYPGAPNLVLDYLYLPLSACGLEEGEIGVDVTNMGTTPITKFSLSYRIDGGAPVEQEFTTKIGVLETVRVVFDRKADFSTPDHLYKVSVEGRVLTSENGVAEKIVDEKNGMEGEVRHFTPAGLPFVTNMNKEEDRAQWAYAPGAWSYDNSKVLAIVAEDTLPLVSRCMPLEAGRNYRLNLSYVAGFSMSGILETTSGFDLLLGKPGTPVATWDTLKSYREAQTGGQVVDDEIVFPVKETGNYALAIVLRIKWATLYVREVSVGEIKDHDVVLQDWVTRLGRLTPARHAVKPSFEALVTNRGMNDETGVKIVLRQGDTEIGASSVTADIKKDEAAVFRPVDGQLAKPALNSETTLSISVEMPNTDGNPHDNTAEFTFTATDTAYVFDEVSEDPLRSYGVQKNYTIGNIFTLAETDTLTSVTIGWMDITSQVAADFDVAVEVYPVDMLKRTVGNLMLHYKTPRGLTAGMRTISLPARILPAGSYLIGLTQLGDENMSVGVDDADGYFFVASNGVYVIQGDEGFLGIRANFGTAGAVVGKDIAVNAITAPKDKGMFTANQTIRATYSNEGNTDMTVNFRCMVNDRELTKQVVVKGYESGEVTFTADMSQVGVYTITVEAVAEGDENEDNNVAKKVVECILIDAREMNFEYCDDFSIRDFEPAWKSVDMDTNVPGPHDLTFPNVDAPFGFMAYNSVAAGEVDPYTGKIVNVAHSGTRCGMSLVSAKNNDWLISPEFQMGTTADSLGLEFWVCSSDPDHPEDYAVWVSTTDDNPANFTPIYGPTGAAGEWERVFVKLSDYAGKNIRVAIQCVSENAWMFFVDDIVVKTGTVANEQTVDLSRYIKSYPNPVSGIWTVTAYDMPIRRLELSNVMGHMVFRSADNMQAETYRLDLSQFPAGLYTARVYTDAGVQVLKVMVR